MDDVGRVRLSAILSLLGGSLEFYTALPENLHVTNSIGCTGAYRYQPGHAALRSDLVLNQKTAAHIGSRGHGNVSLGYDNWSTLGGV